MERWCSKTATITKELENYRIYCFLFTRNVLTMIAIKQTIDQIQFRFVQRALSWAMSSRLQKTTPIVSALAWIFSFLLAEFRLPFYSHFSFFLILFEDLLFFLDSFWSTLGKITGIWANTKYYTLRKHCSCLGTFVLHCLYSFPPFYSSNENLYVKISLFCLSSSDENGYKKQAIFFTFILFHFFPHRSLEVRI